MATLTKAGIIDQVSAGSVFSKGDAAQAVDACLDLIKEALARGETVKITGFGNFVVRDKKARTGRNPQTGARITISARRVVAFKAAVPLREKLEL
jgi:integration host factor subunit alpha